MACHLTSPMSLFCQRQSWVICKFSNLAASFQSSFSLSIGTFDRLVLLDTLLLLLSCIDLHWLPCCLSSSLLSHIFPLPSECREVTRPSLWLWAMGLLKWRLRGLAAGKSVGTRQPWGPATPRGVFFPGFSPSSFISFFLYILLRSSCWLLSSLKVLLPHNWLTSDVGLPGPWFFLIASFQLPLVSIPLHAALHRFLRENLTGTAYH